MRRVLSAAAGFAALAGIGPAVSQATGEAAPIYGVRMPEGYRGWALIAVAHEEGKLNDLRAILGNAAAVEAALDGRLPYPDGSIIVRLAWDCAPLAESEKAFGHPQTFVAGSAKNGVQFMVKDSVKYASSGGWGFAQFDEGKAAAASVQSTCFACHATVRNRDFVFNRYAP